MDEDLQCYKQAIADANTRAPVRKSRSDLVILRYMARRLHVTLHMPDQPVNTTWPLLYFLEDRHRRTHRIVIYKPQEVLLSSSNLAFVGFISGKQRPVRLSIVEEIRIVDKKLVVELVSNPGLLSYSSLELYNNNWCNLVLFSDAGAKTFFKIDETHRYAAHQLAPHYYEWIRLHHGVMPGGLASNEMILQCTRHYTFSGEQLRLSVQERIHQT